MILVEGTYGSSGRFLEGPAETPAAKCIEKGIARSDRGSWARLQGPAQPIGSKVLPNPFLGDQ
jgi:hypothetical protein